ncbi:FAS1-like dehydratase domain-containing protein [Granulicoccus phenolivorans]|uniref:FAS1-like dehydratase domain-containing protein n=1 Tax=Granulicoccus phenolivorans TaxID=266854 RepID=UPI001B7FBEDD|nr:MaoC family dehydratase N-terminal domain-containing protein [Granulicoccus phenolivorans]
MRSHISEAMRAVVGRLAEWRVSFPVNESDIRRWAIATYYPSPPPREYLDAEFAEAERGGYVAPDEFNPFAWLLADHSVPLITPKHRDPDRVEKALGIRGPGLSVQLNGGTAATYGVPMRVGDVIRSELRVIGYRERAGRHGLMLFTLSEQVWTNQRGDHVRSEINTSIRY